MITIENLFYNVATRRKALSNPSEEFTKITEVVMKYAVHNSTVGFTLKKHGDPSPQVRRILIRQHTQLLKNTKNEIFKNIIVFRYIFRSERHIIRQNRVI